MNPANIYAVKRLLTDWQAAGFALDTDLATIAVTVRLGVLGVEFRRPGGTVFRVGLYAALAGLGADLAPEANVCALVATPGQSADNGLYAKTGAPGAGGWTKQADFSVGDPMLAQLRGLFAAFSTLPPPDNSGWTTP